MAQEYYYSSLTGPQLDAALLQVSQAADYAASAAADAAAAQSSALAAAQYAQEANGYSEAESDSRFATSILCEAAGTAITVSDAARRPLTGLQLFGRTVLSGTPAPTAPVQMTSIGTDITLTLTGDQTLPLSLTEAFRGIPMEDSCENHSHTDAAGQKWFSDEIDLAQGLYIQRCFTLTFDGTEGWKAITTTAGRFVIDPSAVSALSAFEGDKTNLQCYHMCSHFESRARRYGDADGRVTSYYNAYGPTLCFTYSACADLESWKAYLAQQAAAGTPVTVVLGRRTPLETALPQETWEAFRGLLPQKGSNTVQNDAAAYMTLCYVADTKIYIDRKLAAISAAILNS